jgi:hypothetical protein
MVRYVSRKGSQSEKAVGGIAGGFLLSVSRMVRSHHHCIDQCASKSASKVEIPESNDPIIAVAASTPRGKPMLQAAAMKIAITGRAITK